MNQENYQTFRHLLNAFRQPRTHYTELALQVNTSQGSSQFFLTSRRLLVALNYKDHVKAFFMLPFSFQRAPPIDWCCGEIQKKNQLGMCLFSG